MIDDIRHIPSFPYGNYGCCHQTINIMPQVIEHIDAIARHKQRDVLFLKFSDPENPDGEIKKLNSDWDWETSVSRQLVIEWLNNNQISWQACGDVANINSMRSYAGQIFIDVPFEETNPVYRQVLDYLENPDGSTRRPGVWFFALTHHAAMKNAHHDEPGFWDRWAENF